MAFVPTVAAQCQSGGGTVAGPLLCRVTEGEALQLTVNITEPDADDNINLLTMSAPTATGATFSPNTLNTYGSFSWTPNFTQGDTTGGVSPTYTITFSAQDSKNASVQGAVNVKVTNNNRPPQINLIAGTVGSDIVCKADPPTPPDPSTGEQNRTASCFLKWNASQPETLLAKLSVTDPDGDNTVDVTFESDDLP